MGPSRSAESQGQCEHKMASRHTVTYADFLFTELSQSIPQVCYFSACEPPDCVCCRDHDQTPLDVSCLTAPFVCLFCYFSLRSFLVSSLYRVRSLCVSDYGQAICDSIHGKGTGNSCFSAGAHWTSHPIHFWDAFHGGQVGRLFASI